MLLAVTICVFVALGAALARRIDGGPLERATAALIIGSVVWLASAWALALTHLLTREMLLVRTGVAAVAWLFLKAEGARRTWDAMVRGLRGSAFPLLPSAFCLLPFIIYILWRGWVIPPLSHDALTYHLPKALLWMRAHGFVYPAGLDASVRQLPANYEMLLAEVLALDGSDRIVEWVTTFFSIAFVVACGAVVERWWGRSRIAATAVMLATASAPALLLQSGAIKNDAMTAFFMVAVLVWGGRFWRRRDTPALLLLLAAGAAGTGTKPQAAILCAALAPFVLWRLARRHGGAGRPAGIPRIVLAAAVTVLSFALLGGAVYVTNYTHRIGAMDLALEKSGSRARGGSLTWGDWRNLWEGPWVLVAAPLSGTDDDLYVPGYARPWFWRRYELYFSHLGVPFTIAVLFLPLALLRWRGDDREAGGERMIVSLAALATFAFMLPVVFYPHGLYDAGLPRYVFFLLPVVYGWTIAPAAIRLETHRAPLARLGIAALALWFALQAIEYAVADAFAPLPYVLWASRHPGTRVIRFDPNRAASVVDRMAGPHDTVAVEASPGAWIYPAYGAGLDREVVLLPPGSGPDAVPPDVRWVAIDRANSVAWAAPGFTDLSHAREAIAQRVISPADLAFFRRYGADPRFRTTYFNGRTAQAVFRRIAP